MKKTLLLSIALFALVTNLVQRPAKCETAGARRPAQSQQPRDEGSAARIARIENDLPPAVVIKGQAGRTHLGKDRGSTFRGGEVVRATRYGT